MNDDDDVIFVFKQHRFLPLLICIDIFIDM